MEYDLSRICDTMSLDAYNPDVIVGLSRGGLVPGVMLSHHLAVPFIPLQWQTRDGNVQDILAFKKILDNNIGKQILVVDDINDTGETLSGIRSQTGFEDHVRYAVLLQKEGTIFTPNYVARHVQDEWVVFPFEDWYTNS